MIWPFAVGSASSQSYAPWRALETTLGSSLAAIWWRALPNVWSARVSLPALRHMPPATGAAVESIYRLAGERAVWPAVGATFLLALWDAPRLWGSGVGPWQLPDALQPFRRRASLAVEGDWEGPQGDREVMVEPPAEELAQRREVLRSLGWAWRAGHGPVGPTEER